LPVKSRKSEELITAKQALERSTSEIVQKEEQIRKLRAENKRLQKVASLSEDAVGAKQQSALRSSSVRDLHGKPVTMRDKIKEIKMRTKQPDRKRSTNSIDRSFSTSLLQQSPKTPTIIPESSNEDLCDEPLSFGVSLDEARRRRATQTEDERRKTSDTDWEVSEIVVL